MRETYVSADALLGWLNASQGAQELIKQVAVSLCEADGNNPMYEHLSPADEDDRIYAWERYTDSARNVLDFLFLNDLGKRVLELQILWSNFREAEQRATDLVERSGDES
jgi:hypothetical protein